MARLTGWAALIWGVAAIVNRRVRRQSDVPAAIFFPLFVPLAICSWSGRLDLQDKYCAHVIGAVAVGIAVPLVTTLRIIGSGAGRYFSPKLGSWVETSGARLLAYAIAAVIALYPVAGALGLFVGGTAHMSKPLGLDYQDLMALKRILAHERGWDLAQVFRNLKASDGDIWPAALRWVPEWPQVGKENDLERAYLLKVPAALISEPLPPSVRVANSSSSEATILGIACSWIDWRSFRVCLGDSGGAHQTCVQTGLALPQTGPDGGGILPGMPATDARYSPGQTMTLHFALNPREECPEEWIYMPRLVRTCPGRIVHNNSAAQDIDDPTRWTKLRLHDSSTDTVPLELAVSFDLGDPKCEYRGYPPFFVEGDPATVASLAAILERQGRIQGYRR